MGFHYRGNGRFNYKARNMFTYYTIGGDVERRYYKGKYYYLSRYDDKEGFLLSFTTAFILIIIGLLSLLSGTTVKKTAVVSWTSTNYDSNGAVYETFGFTYSRLGNKYEGRGKEKAYLSNGRINFDVNRGDEYTVYVNIFCPKKYQFDRFSSNTILTTTFFTLFGFVYLIVSLSRRYEFVDVLEKIGDTNGDGKIDDEDYYSLPESAKEYYANKLPDNLIVKKCPFCGEEYNAENKRCPYCISKVYKDYSNTKTMIMKKCPYCGEDYQIDKRRCPFCNSKII